MARGGDIGIALCFFLVSMMDVEDTCITNY